MTKTYRVKSDPLTVREAAYLAGVGALYGLGGFVAVAALVAPAAWVAYRLEKRWQHANAELTQPKRTGVGGALDAAADRGTR